MPFWVVQLLKNFYQLFLSPILHLLAGFGMGCRFEPTCSNYAFQAIQLHGWIRGIFLALSRICRCHPFTEPGYDPVPHGNRRKLEKKLTPHQGR